MLSRILRRFFIVTIAFSVFFSACALGSHGLGHIVLRTLPVLLWGAINPEKAAGMLAD